MRVVVLGATGFLGRSVVQRLLAKDAEVVGVARHKKGFDALGPDVDVVVGDIKDPESYAKTLAGADASVHLVGVLKENRFRGRTHARVVVQGTRDWLAACKASGVKRIVYVSAIGARADGVAYGRGKWAAEELVRESGLDWTILRPSFIVGDDGVVEMFRVMQRFKVVPIWGLQTYRYDPVDVDDVAAAVVGSLTNPKARSKVFSIGGPTRVTYKEFHQAIAKATGRRPWFVPMPWSLAYAVGFLLGWLPFFPADVGLFRLLREGNTSPDDEWTRTFKVKPMPLDESLSKHLAR